MHTRSLPRCSLMVPIALIVALTTAGVAPASEEGHAAADQVSLASYQDFMENELFTHDGDNRGPSGPEHDLARDNIFALFSGYGLSVYYDTFSYGGGTYENVVAEQLGTVYPDAIYVIGAHYDSVSNPGADDNASGVALVLEAARIISQYDSEYTIRFIAFDMEEVGLVGSAHYADQHFADDIRGMISADMVAYDTGSNYARIYSQSWATTLRTALGAAIDEYGVDLTWLDAGWISASDHASFDAQGFEAALIIEGEVWENPYYHTQQDSVDNPGNINYDFALKMVRSAVGYLVDNAGVLVDVSALGFDYPAGHPALSSPAGGTSMLVDVVEYGGAVAQPASGLFHYNTAIGWVTVPMDVVDADTYEAVFPPAICGADVLYYFSVEAEGGAVFSDPRDAPATTYAVTAAYGEISLFDDDFETDQGWAVSGDASDGQWERGVPVNFDRGDPPTDYDGSGNCYLTDNDPLYENSDVDGGTTILTSPAMDLPDGAIITYAYWLNDVSGGLLGAEDSMTVQAATDAAGTNWATIRTYDTAAAGWRSDEIEVGVDVAASATLRIRFSASDLDPGNVVEAGVDAFKVTAYQCQPPDVIGDMNCDGLVNNGDIDPFVLAVTDAGAYELAYPACDILRGDCNEDGLVNNGDIDAFLALL